MNGVHDMGGMHGFGAIEREPSEPVFHEAWEGRVYGIVTTIRQEHDVYAPYGSRHYIENIPPASYLSASYYEKWMLALEAALVHSGLLTETELAAATRFYEDNPSTAVPRREDPDLAERARRAIYTPQPQAHLPEAQPRFAVGDRVRARNINPRGHTRLPRYTRGKTGVIADIYKPQVFQDHPPQPDAHAQPVYSVRFEAAELWGDAAEPNQSLYIDMWENYLEPI